MTGAEDDKASEAAELIARATLEEKVALLAGTDLWHTTGIERLGIPPVRVTDGPVGARGTRFSGGPPSAAFPCATALAASFDIDLVERIGRELAAEAKAKGAAVLLAPTLNLHRHPLAGRNFECFSEDPYLTARLGVAYVRGVQSAGVAATVKHLVANDSEFERMTISSEVDEQVLRDIYLRPFHDAIVEGGARCVMAAYNKLWGSYCTEHRWLLEEVLRNEWGFTGLVMSDWGATHDTAAAVIAGTDLEMPGPSRVRGDQLIAAIENGEVPNADLDERAATVARFALECGPPGPEGSDDTAARRQAIRGAAAQGTVLVKNEGLLPLDPSTIKTLAVIGPNADADSIMGGGSAQVRPYRAITALDGLREAFATVIYEPGCVVSRGLARLDRRWITDVVFEFADGRTEPGDGARFVWLNEEVPQTVRATVVVPVGGRHTVGVRSSVSARLSVDGVEFDGDRGEIDVEEGSTHDVVVHLRDATFFTLCELRWQAPAQDDLLDRAASVAAGADAAVVVVGMDSEWETEGRDRESLDLPGDQYELVDRIVAAQPNTVVVVNAGAPVSLPFLDAAPAVLIVWYPGQEGGHALADVLAGRADPGGRLPQTWPHRLEDAPAFPFYPGSGGKVDYGEGHLIGYRHYHANGVSPMLAFGHGVSYTTFSWSGGRRDGPGVVVDVTNTGDRPGTEVVQAYVEGDYLQLAGFASVSLAAGETRPVTIPVDALVPAGAKIRLGRSARDLLDTVV